MKPLLAAVVVCLFAGGGTARAQPAPDAAALEARIAALQQQLDALKAQVEALQRAGGASPVIPSTPAALAGTLAYQHSWNKTLRSTVTYGFAWVDSKNKTFTTTFNESEYAAANAIWTLRGTPFNVGIEYLWGRQQLKSGETGDASRLQFSVQYDIVR